MHNVKPLPQNPFALYDFLGYLVPGIVFVGCALFFLYEINPKYIQDLMTYIRKIKISGDVREELKLIDYAIEVIIIIFFLVGTYVIGQLLGILSSISIGKIYNRIYGYPGNSLMEEDRKNGKFYDLFNPDEKWLILKKCKKICEEMNKEVEYIKKSNVDYYFFMIYHYVIETECPHLAQINNYRSLYIFFRNLCFIFSCFAVLFFVRIFCALCPYNSNFSFHVPSIIAFSILTYLSYLGFDKYYKKFAKEVLYAALVNKSDNTINLQSPNDKTIKLQITKAKTLKGKGTSKKRNP